MAIEKLNLDQIPLISDIYRNYLVKEGGNIEYNVSPNLLNENSKLYKPVKKDFVQIAKKKDKKQKKPLDEMYDSLTYKMLTYLSPSENNVKKGRDLSGQLAKIEHQQSLDKAFHNILDGAAEFLKTLILDIATNSSGGTFSLEDYPSAITMEEDSDHPKKITILQGPLGLNMNSTMSEDELELNYADAQELEEKEREGLTESGTKVTKQEVNRNVDNDNDSRDEGIISEQLAKSAREDLRQYLTIDLGDETDLPEILTYPYEEVEQQEESSSLEDEFTLSLSEETTVRSTQTTTKKRATQATTTRAITTTELVTAKKSEKNTKKKARTRLSQMKSGSCCDETVKKIDQRLCWLMDVMRESLSCGSCSKCNEALSKEEMTSDTPERTNTKHRTTSTTQETEASDGTTETSDKADTDNDADLSDASNSIQHADVMKDSASDDLIEAEPMACHTTSCEPLSIDITDEDYPQEKIKCTTTCATEPCPKSTCPPINWLTNKCKNPCFQNYKCPCKDDITDPWNICPTKCRETTPECIPTTCRIIDRMKTRKKKIMSKSVATKKAKKITKTSTKLELIDLIDGDSFVKKDKSRATKKTIKNRAKDKNYQAVTISLHLDLGEKDYYSKDPIVNSFRRTVVPNWGNVGALKFVGKNKKDGGRATAKRETSQMNKNRSEHVSIKVMNRKHKKRRKRHIQEDMAHG